MKETDERLMARVGEGGEEARDGARRRPVSGRILREVESEKYDLRVSGFPMIDGPKLTIRVYTPQIRRVALEELGLSREDRARLERWRGRPNGLILIAAPVGSGKSTTQYALLERGASEGSHTIALERHPFARLPQVNQAALDPAAGLGQAVALRAIMRCDPDVIMVEEVPDRVTAIQLPDVAITGHLVIAGVEVGGAVAAVRRLLDLGADSWTLSQTLLGVSAQRLARRVCPHCRVERAAPPRSLQALGWEPAEAPATFAGEGCEKCRERGFLGRVPFFEVLEVTPAVAAHIAENAPAEALVAAAGDSLSPFLADARRKVAEGLASVEEAARVVRQA
jgi:type II secretory ATPase GspE/PulE/Tfp pilus assembly ATPase PilB-like protein